METLDLSAATAELFAPLVGQEFTLEEAAALTLTEAKALAHPPHIAGARQPFRLTFTGPAPLLGQGVRRLRNKTLGGAEIFLVPIAGNGENFTYEAIFN